MKIPSLRILISLFLFFMLLQIPIKCASQQWQPPADNPVELGLVDWGRDYEAALAKAKKEKKPVFMLFQEVPGCATCTTYGNEVMSHPLLVEAIETYFVPLCIYNNQQGSDAAVLKLYGEPSWNNPVVRIVDGNGKNLIRRVNGGYSVEAVVNAIATVLVKKNQTIPDYLAILQTEANTPHTDELILGMYCFWSGEKALATMTGVQETEAGFMGGKEVVKVRFDPSLTDKKKLIEKARKYKCADLVFDDQQVTDLVSVRKKEKYRKDPETKYYLYNSLYRNIPMTSLQSLKVNHILATGGNPDFLLSPRQLALKGKSKKNLIGKEIKNSWIEEYL